MKQTRFPEYYFQLSLAEIQKDKFIGNKREMESKSIWYSDPATCGQSNQLMKNRINSWNNNHEKKNENLKKIQLQLKEFKILKNRIIKEGKYKQES